ncbi:hypothetical protein [Megalodesulfovibrio paquesii]
MKTRFPMIALVLVLGLMLALPAFAMPHRGGHGGGYGGCGMMAGNATDPEFQAKLQKFQEDTVSLRRSLAADWTELQAVLNAQNPDPAKARLLREKIFDTHQKLREAALKAGIRNDAGCPGMGGCGGMMGGGCGGQGQGCM